MLIFRVERAGSASEEVQKASSSEGLKEKEQELASHSSKRS